MQRKFAAFILTHGRPDNVRTMKSLRRFGYTGDVYLLVDNEDETVDQYRANFGAESVITFDKKAVAQTFDTMDLSEERRTIVFARNAVHQVARDMGLTHYLELDDDYNWFRPATLGDDNILHHPDTASLDAVCEAFLDFLDETGAATVAMAQGGDFIGGVLNNLWWKGLKRKAMNTFFVRTDTDLTFLGRINEDVNTYVKEGNRGQLFLTYTRFLIDQMDTQTNAGGMTDAYMDGGTYLKSFPTVMLQPSSVKVAGLNGGSGWRMHHKVDWRRTVPEIVSSRYRKPR